MSAPLLVEPGTDTRVSPHDVPPPARNPAPPLAHHEAARIRAAAHAARRRYPGAVGEVLERELTDWAEFGYRLDRHGLVGRLVDDLTTAKTEAP